MPVDEKVTDFAAITDLLDTDVLYVVSDPGGTPVSKKITKANATKNLNIAGLLKIPVTEHTEASDAITATTTGITVKAETGTSDNLSTINGLADKQFVILYAKTGHTITVKHNTGNIQLPAKNDIILSETKGLILQYDGTNLRVPKLHGNGFNDDSDNPILAFLKVASAVNYLQVRNAATGGNVELDAIGTDSDIGFDIFSKGAGSHNISAVKRIQNAIKTGLGTTGALTLDFSTNEAEDLGTITGNITFSTSNLAAGRSKTIRIKGDGTHTVTINASWQYTGNPASPITPASGKYLIITLLSWGTTDADVVVAAYVTA